VVKTNGDGEKRRFIQALAGPRQVGKTTLAWQAIEKCGLPSHYVSADEPTLQDRTWLNQQWDIARTKTISKNGNRPALLIIDEVQKIPGWSETVKKNSLKSNDIRFFSSFGTKWLTESLAGRFELIPITHWSYNEMKQCFGFTLEQYIYFGGYPGAATLVDEHERWVKQKEKSEIRATN